MANLYVIQSFEKHPVLTDMILYTRNCQSGETRTLHEAETMAREFGKDGKYVTVRLRGETVYKVND